MSSYINWEISDNLPQNDDQLDPNPEFRSVSLWIARIEWNEMYWRNDWWIKMTRIVTCVLLIIVISKHGAKEMGNVKMAGPGFVNDVTRGGSRILRGGGALKKIAPSGGRCENFWGISCEKSQFYPQKNPLNPPLVTAWWPGFFPKNLWTNRNRFRHINICVLLTC